MWCCDSQGQQSNKNHCNAYCVLYCVPALYSTIWDSIIISVNNVILIRFIVPKKNIVCQKLKAATAVWRVFPNESRWQATDALNTHIYIYIRFHPCCIRQLFNLLVTLCTDWTHWSHFAWYIIKWQTNYLVSFFFQMRTNLTIMPELSR